MVHLFQHIIDQLTLNVLLNTTPVTIQILYMCICTYQHIKINVSLKHNKGLIKQIFNVLKLFN